MAKNKKRTPRYSKAEKHAYYVGMGVGLTANGYGTGLTQRAFRMMSDKEKKSYIKGYEKVKSGDLAKIIYLHKNKFGVDKIAYLDTMPPEFEKEFQIDYKTTFIKTVFDELKRIYKSVGWPSFNPADDYAFSLFDLMMREPA